jgi:hypothetical protein
MFLRSTLAFALSCVVSACGPMPTMVQISVVDHPDPLTTAAKDNLFTLSLNQGAPTFELADLLLSAGLPGQTATGVNFQLNDLNGDGKLGAGESLLATEPPLNLFDATLVGQDVSINLSEKKFVVGSTKWKPTN